MTNRLLNKVRGSINVLQPYYFIVVVIHLPQVFKLFATEIQETRKELVEDKKQHPMGLPRYAGRALMAVLKLRRIKTLMRVCSVKCIV